MSSKFVIIVTSEVQREIVVNAASEAEAEARYNDGHYDGGGAYQHTIDSDSSRNLKGEDVRVERL